MALWGLGRSCCPFKFNYALRRSDTKKKKITKKEKGKESEKFDLIGHSTKLNPYYF